jgi:hypothetical protein
MEIVTTETSKTYGTQEYWNSQIQKGLKFRKDNAHEDSWDRIRGYYEHQFTDPSLPHFNLIYIMASSWIPALVFQRPSIINTARRPTAIPWTQIYDGIDNWLVDEMEVQDILKEIIIGAFLNNTMGLELGYDLPSERQIAGVEAMEFKPIEGSADRVRKTNQPWLDTILPERLVLAPGTKSMRNCRWYAKGVYTLTSDLKKMKGLKKNAVIPTEVPSEVARLTGEKYLEELKERGMTFLWVIHEAESKKWMWLNSAGQFVLLPEEDPMQIDGLPLEVISFNHGVHGLWGTPDSVYIESQQIESDECRQDGRLQRRAALIKGFYDNQLLDEEDIVEFLTSDALGMIPVTVPAEKSLQDVIHLIQPHVQGELFEYQKQILNDAQLLVGTGPNQMGTFAPGRRTKYETQVVEERNFLRAGMRREELGNSIGNIFSRVNQIIQKNWNAPVVAQVVGVEGAMYWVSANAAELKNITAQLSTKVNVESMAPVSRQRRKDEMMEVLTILTKVQGFNIIPILQQLLSQFDWLDVTQTLPQANQGNPMGMDQFQGQQQKMLQSPNLQQMQQNNLGGLNRLVNKLPVGQPQAMEGNTNE